MQRHVLRATLITMLTLFHGYLDVSSEEFLDVRDADSLRGHDFKVRHSFRPKEVGVFCSFGQTVERLSSTYRRSYGSVVFMDRLDDDRSSTFPVCPYLLVLQMLWHEGTIV